jgi:hypothetical protein
MFLYARRSTPGRSKGLVLYDYTCSIRNKIYSCTILNLSSGLSGLVSESINIRGSNVPYKFNFIYSPDTSGVIQNNFFNYQSKYKVLLHTYIIKNKCINSPFHEKEAVK